MRALQNLPPALGGGQGGPNGTEFILSPAALIPAGGRLGGQKGPRSIERSPCPPVPQKGPSAALRRRSWITKGWTFPRQLAPGPMASSVALSGATARKPKPVRLNDAG